MVYTRTDGLMGLGTPQFFNKYCLKKLATEKCTDGQMDLITLTV